MSSVEVGSSPKVRNADLEERGDDLEGRDEDLEERNENLEGRDEDLEMRNGDDLDMRNSHSELRCEDQDVRNDEPEMQCEDLEERHGDPEVRVEEAPILQTQISQLQAQIEMMRAQLTNLQEKEEDKKERLRRSESEDIVVQWYRTQLDEGHEVNLPGLRKKKNSRSSAAPRVRPPLVKNVVPSLKNVAPSLKSLKTAVSSLKTVVSSQKTVVPSQKTVVPSQKTVVPSQKSLVTSQKGVLSPRHGHAASPRHVRLNLWDIVQSSLNLAQTSRLGLDTNSTALPLKGKYHEPYNPSGTTGRFMSSLRARSRGSMPDSPRRSSVTRTSFHSTPSVMQSQTNSVDSSQSSRRDAFSFVDDKLSITEVMTTIYCDLADQYGSMEVAAIYAATSLQIIDPREVHKYMEDNLNSDEVTLMSYQMDHASLKPITEHPFGAENERQLLEIIEQSPEKLATLLPPIYLDVQEFEEAMLDVFQLNISRRLARRVFHVLDKLTGRVGRVELKSLDKWHPSVSPPPENCPTPRRRASPSGTSLVGSVAESLDGRATIRESSPVPPPAPGRLRGSARQWQHGTRSFGDVWDCTAPASGSRLSLHNEMDFRTSLRNADSPPGSGWNPVTKTEFKRGGSRNVAQFTRQGTSVTTPDCTSVHLSGGISATASGQTTPEVPGPSRAFLARVHTGSPLFPVHQSEMPSRRRSMPTNFVMKMETVRLASPDALAATNAQQHQGTTMNGATSMLPGPIHAVDTLKENTRIGAQSPQLAPNRVGTKESSVSEESAGQYSRTSQGLKSSKSSGSAVSARQSSLTFIAAQDNNYTTSKELQRPMINGALEAMIQQEPPSTTEVGWACTPTPPLPMDRSFSYPPGTNLMRANGKAEDPARIIVAFPDSNAHASNSYISSSPSAPASTFQINSSGMPDWMRPSPPPISFTIPSVLRAALATPVTQSNPPRRTLQRNPRLTSPSPPPLAVTARSGTAIQPCPPFLSARGGMDGPRSSANGQYTPFFSPMPVGAPGTASGAKTPTLPLSGSRPSISARLSLDMVSKPGTYRPLFSSQLLVAETRNSAVGTPGLVQPARKMTSAPPAGNIALGQAKFVSSTIRAAQLSPMPQRPPFWTYPVAGNFNRSVVP